MEDNKVFIIAATIVVLSVIGSVAFYNVNENNNMARNLDNVAGKGIDPIAVRCAYSPEKTTCIVYAAGAKK